MRRKKRYRGKKRWRWPVDPENRFRDMKALRREDPKLWTFAALGKRYKISRQRAQQILAGAA